MGISIFTCFLHNSKTRHDGKKLVADLDLALPNYPKINFNLSATLQCIQSNYPRAIVNNRVKFVIPLFTFLHLISFHLALTCFISPHSPPHCLVFCFTLCFSDFVFCLND